MKILSNLIAFVFTCLCLSSSAQQPTSAKTFASLDTAFDRVLRAWHAPGFAVAVVQKDKVIYARGFGFRDVENKVPVTDNTLFAIGSCTKAFTASLLGMLERDGLVDLDKPVRDYLPELKFHNDQMNDKITLRDMMCHRTGLPRHDFSWYYFTTSSRDSLVARIQYQEPSAGLREKWQYNNFMFMAQGVVVEKLTGKSWESNVREKILNPLGMSSTVFSIADLQKSNDAAKGYGLKNDSIIKKVDYYVIDGMGPAGSINSSVHDMAQWVTTWIYGGKFGGKEIFPASYYTQAMTPQMVMGGGTPDQEMKDVFFQDYGFGWMLSSYRGHYRVEHGGNINGFSASTSFFPSDSIGIVVLCNQESSSVPSVVRNLIADRLLGLKYVDWSGYLQRAVIKAKAQQKQAKQSMTSDGKPTVKPMHPLSDYEGLFNNKGYGTFEVKHQGGDSLWILVGSHIWWLKPHRYNTFQVFEKDPKEGIDTSDRGYLVQFVANTQGDIESVDFTFDPTLKPVNFSRTFAEKGLPKDSLIRYTGEYAIGGEKIKIFIKNDRELFMAVAGQPEYELLPIAQNKFTIKTLTGFSVQFNTNDKNEVVELLSIQPNGTFKAVKQK